MGTIGRVSATAVSPSPGSRAGGPAALARALVREPFTRRARLELLFCLAGIPLGLCVLLVPYWGFGFALAVVLLTPGHEPTWVAGVATILALLLLVVLATRIGRRLGAVHRRLAARLLDEPVAPPPPRPRQGVLGRLGAGLRDGPGWRAVAYQLLKLPAAVPEAYAVYQWTAGLVNLTYPFWWGLFRNHPPGVTLDPVPAATPFFGGTFPVATFGGTFAAFAAGVAMVLAAPWVTRAVVAGDRERLSDVGATMIDASLCGLGQTAPTAILSAMKLWPEMFERQK